MVNREWAACVRDDARGVGGWRWGGASLRQRRGGRYREKRGDGKRGESGCEQETCFEILICGFGRGLVHRDEKMQGNL